MLILLKFFLTCYFTFGFVFFIISLIELSKTENINEHIIKLFLLCEFAATGYCVYFVYSSIAKYILLKLKK